ncbi:MAG: response regulator transcription factor [Bdellovibrionaceae bacterium]|nr:response regulator transcription factor [Bdellovibrio sp.]
MINAIVVEDELAIANLLKIHLSDAGFGVHLFHDAESALIHLQNSKVDICLLDWMLPGTQGIDFLKRIRQHNKSIKIMMVTAKSDPDSIVEGLDAGADDYLPKPFDAKVLNARVRNLVRRHEREKQNPSSVDEMTIDGMQMHFTKHFVKLSGVEVHLTPSEFKLLASLFKVQGQVLTREQLIELVQGEDIAVTGRTIDTHVFALRKKLGVWAGHIETIRGVGYRVLISLEDSSENADGSE